MKVVVVGGFHTPDCTAANLVEAFRSVYPTAEVVERREQKLGGGYEFLTGADMMVWARDHGGMAAERRELLRAAGVAGVPTIGFHTDQWWGLERQAEIRNDPFFRCDWMVTTDGGNQELWSKAGVKHVWMPPATRRVDTEWVAERDPVAAGKAVFVGAWERYFHPEWPWRVRMIKQLRAEFGPRFVCFPQSTRSSVGKRVTGQALANIVGSAAVVVGDSALAGQAPGYWSDRVPITLGMGGMLVHPTVPGMDAHFQDGVHLRTFPAQDIRALIALVHQYLVSGPDTGVQAAGRAEVQACHTFDHRVRSLVTLAGVHEP